MSLQKYFTIILLSIVIATLSSSFAQEKSLETAPDFTCKSQNNEAFTLSSNLGKGPIIINFWATWCGPCILEMKSMKEIYKKYSTKGLKVVSISIDDNKTQSQVPGVVRSYKLPYTILLDPNKEVYKQFNASNVPEIFIIDKKGKIVYHHQGFQKGDEKKTDEIIANLIAKDK